MESAASTIGGVHYAYAMRGDGREAVRPTSGQEQRAALDALLETLQPSDLAVPQAVLEHLPPRPSGWSVHRELFPRYTGPTFDAITPAVVAADLTISNVLEAARAARVVQQHALDPSIPGLDAVIDRLASATFGARAATPYEAEIARATQRVLIDNLTALAADAPMPQVRAIATYKLKQRLAAMSTPIAGADAAAHAALLAADIKRFLERPSTPAQRIETRKPRRGRRSGIIRWSGCGVGPPYVNSPGRESSAARRRVTGIAMGLSRPRRNALKVRLGSSRRAPRRRARAGRLALPPAAPTSAGAVPSPFRSRPRGR